MENKLSGDKLYNLWIMLRQTVDVIFKARSKELRKYGISPRKAAVMFAIQSIGDKAMSSEISKWLFREYNTVSTILIRLEKDGLVNKIKSKDKNSRFHVSLTEKGQQAFRQSLKRESIHEILSCLSEEERQQLESLLKKVRNTGLQKLVSTIELPFP